MVNWTATIYTSLEALETGIEATANSSDIEIVADPITGRFLMAKTV